jgi:ornithine decarboxylase
MTTQRILDFLATERPDGPCLVVDLDVVRQNFEQLERAFAATGIYYAVKANPAPEILELLTSLGSCFDTASVPEIEMALAAGATPDRISYGNTIKKERDIARAYELGIRLFAVDCIEEVEKIARQAPGARVFCRVLTDGVGAEWPLSRKFGCDTEMAVKVLERARALGLDACGLSFHVGSQQCDLNSWDKAVGDAKQVFQTLAAKGISLTMLNLGGGFPTRYLKDVPSTIAYAEAIQSAMTRHFGNKVPATIIEPGRGLVGNAGTIKTEVVLISRKSENDDTRWVYLDIGKFGGLAETMDESIRYPIVSPHDGGAMGPCIVAGPTCDSADVLYEKTPYDLPLTLQIGDELLIEATGAYTSTYASIGFNGFAPLETFIIGGTAEIVLAA